MSRRVVVPGETPQRDELALSRELMRRMARTALLRSTPLLDYFTKRVVLPPGVEDPRPKEYIAIRQPNNYEPK